MRDIIGRTGVQKPPSSMLKSAVGEKERRCWREENKV